jgi:hypothetical protein
MDEKRWPGFLGAARLSKTEIAKVIAEHTAAKYGVEVSSVKVELFMPKGQYGTEAFANVHISGFADAVRTKT